MRWPWRSKEAGDPGQRAGDPGRRAAASGGEGIPWRWDPAQFARYGPFKSVLRYMFTHPGRRRRMSFPKSNWIDNPIREVDPEGREVLFDSWVMLDLRRGCIEAAQLVEKAQFRYISALTYMDMLAASTAVSEGMMVQGFLQQTSFEVIPVSEAISRRAELYMEYYGISYGLSPRSALIAATAYEEELVLASRLSDYRQLPDLEIAAYPG